MLPAIFPLITAASAVTAIIGSNPCRFYRHGNAPQAVTAPYCTWFVVSGTPENTLEAVPRVDNYSVQIDCWSDNTGAGSAGVIALATAVRNALEPHAHMTAISSDSRDPETMRYRVSLTFTFWTDRT